MEQLIIYFVVLGAMYFLLIRPQQVRNKKLSQLRDNIKVGSRIVTIGGLVGRVTNVVGDEFILEVEGTSLKFKKWALSSVVGESNETN